MKRKFIDEAKPHWDSQNAVEAGRILYEHIRPQHRPLWAAAVLAHCLSLFPAIPEVQAVHAIALDPNRWLTDSRTAFDGVRSLMLRRQHEPESLLSVFLRLAELTAKVAYNASGGSAPYDHNSGWRIVSVLRHLCDLHGDPDFTATAWRIVSCEDFSDPNFT